MVEHRLNVVPKILFICAPGSARKPKLYTQASGQVLPRRGLGRGKQIYLDNDRSDASLVIRALSSERISASEFVASSWGLPCVQYSRKGLPRPQKSNARSCVGMHVCAVRSSAGFARLSGQSKQRNFLRQRRATNPRALRLTKSQVSANLHRGPWLPSSWKFQNARA